MSDQEILAKCSNGQRNPFKGDNNLYNILYKTTCMVNGKVYVGVHSSKTVEDSYIGGGIKTDYSTGLKDYKDPLSMPLGNCVRLYGVGAFKRVNLLYFNTVDDALIQEKRVVDHQWVRDRRTLNLKIGGIKPPRRVGEKNGNYGNKWSQEMKDHISVIRKDRGVAKGSLNPNAKPIVMINIYTLEVHKFLSAYDAQKTLSPSGNHDTLLTFLQKGKLFERKWVPLYTEVYLRETDIRRKVVSFIEKSRFVKQIKQNLKWNI